MLLINCSFVVYKLAYVQLSPKYHLSETTRLADHAVKMAPVKYNL